MMQKGRSERTGKRNRRRCFRASGKRYVKDSLTVLVG